MFLPVGSGNSESTMSRFPHASNASTFWAILAFMVVEFEDASTSFCGRKSPFGSCLFTHDGASTSNRVSWIQQQFVTPARFADRGMPGHGLGTRSQTESECSNQKLKLELLRGSRPKLEILPVSVVVHEHLVRAGCMFFGTTTRRTLTRLHRLEL